LLDSRLQNEVSPGYCGYAIDTARQIKPTRVGFRAHVNITSRETIASNDCLTTEKQAKKQKRQEAAQHALHTDTHTHTGTDTDTDTRVHKAIVGTDYRIVDVSVCQHAPQMYATRNGARRICGVNAPLPTKAKKILKI